MSKIVHMRYPGGKSKAFTLSYDDGVHCDLRLARIMKKHGIHGTFNVNSERARLAKTKNLTRKHPLLTCEELQEFVKNYGSFAEIASHGATHGFFPKMAQDVASWELISDRKAIEELLSLPCRGFAYPYGQTDDKTVEALRVCGFRYARLTARQRSFLLPADPFRWQCTTKHTDPELMDYARDFIELKTNRYGQGPYLFSVWGHSYEFDDDDNWNVIEELCAFMGGREEIWYCTNIEFFDYARDFERLEYSADQSCVYNPTARTLFLSVYDTRVWKEYTVLPGQTVRFD